MEISNLIQGAPASPAEGSGTVRGLLARGLLTPGDLVDGVTIRGQSRRNGNLLVEIRGKAGLLIKEPGPEARATLRQEGLFYVACAAEPRWAEIARLLPRLRHFSAEGPVVVCELLPDAPGLFELYGAGDPAPEAAAALGAALGLVHATFRRELPALETALPDLRKGPALGMRIHRPPPAIRQILYPAQQELLRLIQNDRVLTRALDRCLARWRNLTLIHGDIRSDNLLFAGPERRLHLIDWELLQWGDPAWDLGAALSAHLEYGLKHPSPAALPECTRALWQAYLAAARPPARERAPLRRRAVACAAVHLLQLAWTSCREDGPPAAIALRCLELAGEILAGVESAGRNLFRIGDTAILSGDG